MTTRDTAPVGAPCWADLWTSDVEGSRRFYAELFGWEAQEPSPEFGGYFMFTRNGEPIAGGMGDMGDMRANNTWKTYLATDDIQAAMKSAESTGAHVVVPGMPVADLGVQGVLVDATGAEVGLWQPGTFGGFRVLGEPGAPSWFELHTADFARSLDFYRDVFGLESVPVSDTDDFRYALLRRPGNDEDLAGVMDAGRFLPEGVTGRWWIYWEVDDSDRTISAATSLGGTLVTGPHDTPYGRLATLRDPAGAEFKLRTRPS